MKKVLITGASRGLGKCLAEVFGQAGYHLILHSKTKEVSCVNKTFSWDKNYNEGREVTCETVKGDINEPDTIAKLQEASEGGLDILINNAGIYTNKYFPETTPKDFTDIINTNLIAPIMLTKAIWPIFEKKKSGVVIFINSVAGKCGSPAESAYCASKFGLKGFADSLQYDGDRAGVKVISVFVGGMRTDMTKDRGYPELHIDPHEVALMIFDLSKEYKGAEATEVVIDRIGRCNR